MRNSTAILLLASLAVAAPQAIGQTTRPTTAAIESLAYEAPASAGQPTRVRGPSRSAADPMPVLLALSPEHTGLTIQSQPSLFWYQSKPAKGNLVLTVTKDGQAKDAKDAEPLLELSLDAGKSGIQRVDLGQHQAKLDVGVQYRWCVALVCDPDRRAEDVVSSAAIMRIAPPEALMSRLTRRSSAVDRAAVYLKQGIWYDGLAALSDQIDSGKGDAALRQQRAALFEKIDLPEAAAFDRGQ